MPTVLVHLNAAGALDWKLVGHGQRWHSNVHGGMPGVSVAVRQHNNIGPFLVEFLDAAERERM